MGQGERKRAHVLVMSHLSMSKPMPLPSRPLGSRTKLRILKLTLQVSRQEINLRELSTFVNILDQAREGGALRGKICDRFPDDDCYPPYPFVSRGTEGTDR